MQWNNDRSRLTTQDKVVVFGFSLIWNTQTFFRQSHTAHGRFDVSCSVVNVVEYGSNGDIVKLSKYNVVLRYEG